MTDKNNRMSSLRRIPLGDSNIFAFFASRFFYRDYRKSNAFNLRINLHLKISAVAFLNIAQNNPLLRGEDALASGVCSSLKTY